MSKYVLREQRAIHTPSGHFVDAPRKRSTTESRESVRATLPDVGLSESRRIPNSTRRYVPTTQTPMRLVVHDLRTHRKPQPAPKQPAPKPEHQMKPAHQTRRLPALTLIGSGMVLMILLYFLGTSLITFFQSKHDDWTYGNPRTSHIDARVGHGDEMIPSHFIAMNLNREVRIIEFPGNDASKAKVYVGPVLQGEHQEKAPVTLNFRDVNRDNKPDMLILVRGIAVGVFLNDVIRDVEQFRPAKPDEHLFL